MDTGGHISLEDILLEDINRLPGVVLLVSSVVAVGVQADADLVLVFLELAGSHALSAVAEMAEGDILAIVESESLKLFASLLVDALGELRSTELLSESDERPGLFNSHTVVILFHNTVDLMS